MRFLFFYFSLLGFLNAQHNHPVPEKTSELLFYVQHNLNHNTYVYELNLEAGKLNDKNPIKVFRINYEDKKQKENLSIMQRKYAYGINYLTTDKLKFHLSANKNIPMILKSNGIIHWVEVDFNNKKIILDKIFIQSDKNTKGLKTKVESILLYGRDMKGNLIQEKFIP